MHEASQLAGLLQHMEWWQFPIRNHGFLLAFYDHVPQSYTNQRVYPRGGEMSHCIVVEKAKLDALGNARDI